MLPWRYRRRLWPFLTTLGVFGMTMLARYIAIESLDLPRWGTADGDPASLYLTVVTYTSAGMLSPAMPPPMAAGWMP